MVLVLREPGVVLGPWVLPSKMFEYPSYNDISQIEKNGLSDPRCFIDAAGHLGYCCHGPPPCTGPGTSAGGPLLLGFEPSGHVLQQLRFSYSSLDTHTQTHKHTHFLQAGSY